MNVMPMMAVMTMTVDVALETRRGRAFDATKRTVPRHATGSAAAIGSSRMMPRIVSGIKKWSRWKVMLNPDVAMRPTYTLWQQLPICARNTGMKMDAPFHTMPRGRTIVDGKEPMMMWTVSVSWNSSALSDLNRMR